MGRSTQHKISDLECRQLLLVNDGYRAKNSELGCEGLPFARAGNLNNGFNFDGCDRFPIENLAKVGAKVSEFCDVVFTSKGTVGRFGRVSHKTDRFIYSPQLCFWRSLDHEVIDPTYLFYWMRSPLFIAQINAVKGQTDMADYVSLRDQRDMLLTLPDITTQRMIAAELVLYDDLIDNLVQQNQTLEKMAQAIFKHWFVDFEFPDKNGKPYKSSGGNMVDSELGEIPEGWCIVQLSDIAERAKGSINPSRSEPREVAHYSIPAYDRDQLPTIECLSKIKSNKTICPPPCILFSKLNPTTPRVWNLPCESDAPLTQVCSTEFIPILAGSTSYHSFLYSLLSSPQLTRTLAMRVTGTSSSHQRLQPSDLLEYLLVFDRSTADSFSRICDPISLKVAQNRELSESLVKIRDLVLPKLISGEIAIGELEE